MIFDGILDFLGVFWDFFGFFVSGFILVALQWTRPVKEFLKAKRVNE